jgi:hypothetical protein
MELFRNSGTPVYMRVFYEEAVLGQAISLSIYVEDLFFKHYP